MLVKVMSVALAIENEVEILDSVSMRPRGGLQHKAQAIPSPPPSSPSPPLPRRASDSKQGKLIESKVCLLIAKAMPTQHRITTAFTTRCLQSDRATQIEESLAEVRLGANEFSDKRKGNVRRGGGKKASLPFFLLFLKKNRTKFRVYQENAEGKEKAKDVKKFPPE